MVSCNFVNSKCSRFKKNGGYMFGKRKLFVIVMAIIVVSFLIPEANLAYARVVKRDKSVVFSAVWPPQLDPAVGQGFGSAICYANIYDSIVFPQSDGTIANHLAENIIVSTDGLVYDITLKQGVKFHNGDELQAKDVVFSMNRIRTIGEGFGYLFIPTVKAISSDGPYQVTIELNKAFGPFLSTLVNLYILNEAQVMANLDQEGAYGEFGDYGKGWLITHDAGSGPYMVSEMRIQEHMIAERFVDYWEGFDANNPDKFIFVGTVEPVTTRVMMGKRELEISDQWQSEESFAALDKIDGVELVKFLSGSTLGIQLNTKRAPTDDVHIRKALAYIMDYEGILKGVYPGASRLVSPVSLLMPGSDPNIVGYQKNLEKALEEVKLSKYYDNLDEYPVDVCYAAEWVTADKIALLFQASAAQVGIKVNIAKQPWAKMISDVSKMETTAHANILTIGPHYGEAGTFISRYLSSSCGTWEQTEWLQSEMIDNMINDALATVNVTKRYIKYTKIQKTILDLCPTIFLVDVLEKHAYQSDYLEWGVVDQLSQGGKAIPVQGYNMYMRNIKVFPEKAKK